MVSYCMGQPICQPIYHGLPSPASRGQKFSGQSDVRFGSKADMCSAGAYVRFYPRKRHQTRHMGMSARAKSRLMLCSKKDRYSITLSARASTLDGNAKPSALAATEERSIRSACHSARIRKCAARHLAPGGARDELNAPPLCSTGKESA